MSRNIFILDMDECIIGNSKFILDYHILITQIKKLTDNNPPIHKDLWKKNISPHFIRPYFKEFLDFCKKNNIELFIFSFGTKDYVEYIIEYIEETFDYKFNRPLFTREDKYIGINDDNYMKEITGFQDIIIKSIKAKPLEIENIFSYHILIIDDNYNFWSSNNPQLLITTSYQYTPIPHLDINLLHQIKNNQDIMDYIINSSNSLFPTYIKSSNSYDDFFLNYHLYTSELFRKNLQNNNEVINDDFFKSLIPLIKPRLKLQKPFTTKFIKSLNKSFKD